MEGAQWKEENHELQLYNWPKTYLTFVHGDKWMRGRNWWRRCEVLRRLQDHHGGTCVLCNCSSYSVTIFRISATIVIYYNLPILPQGMSVNDSSMLTGCVMHGAESERKKLKTWRTGKWKSMLRTTAPHVSASYILVPRLCSVPLISTSSHHSFPNKLCSHMSGTCIWTLD
jgi:hypothetical protein